MAFILVGHWDKISTNKIENMIANFVLTTNKYIMLLAFSNP